MYYVDRHQIEERLGFAPYVAHACERLAGGFDGSDPVHVLAQERALHLAVEIVTDVGSLLIDGFLMRDASSYEDIVDILRGENVVSTELGAALTELVKLRRPLVQQYMALERGTLRPATEELPELLAAFAESVRTYIANEL